MGYDANIAAPLIFSQPGRINPDQLCAEPVNGVDIVQTFHSIAGIQPVMTLHGRDMTPLLKDPTSRLKEPMLLTHTARLYGEKFLEAIKLGIFVGQKNKPAYLMMRDGQYKYIRHMKKETIEELYDLDQDPGELNNLAVNPEHRPLLRKLRRKAADGIRKKDGEFIDLLPQPRVHADTT